MLQMGVSGLQTPLAMSQHSPIGRLEGRGVVKFVLPQIGANGGHLKTAGSQQSGQIVMGL